MFQSVALNRSLGRILVRVLQLYTVNVGPVGVWGSCKQSGRGRKCKPEMQKPRGLFRPCLILSLACGPTKALGCI